MWLANHRHRIGSLTRPGPRISAGEDQHDHDHAQTSTASRRSHTQNCSRRTAHPAVRRMNLQRWTVCSIFLLLPPTPFIDEFLFPSTMRWRESKSGTLFRALFSTSCIQELCDCDVASLIVFLYEFKIFRRLVHSQLPSGDLQLFCWLFLILFIVIVYRIAGIFHPGVGFYFRLSRFGRLEMLKWNDLRVECCNGFKVTHEY